MPDDPPRPPTPREQEVFFAALERPDPAQRAAFLDAECRDEPAVRRWVEAEIRRQVGRDGASRSLHTTHVATASGQRANPLNPETEALLLSLKPEEAGERIGVYKLISPLGEGGFGVVWLAEQEEPVRRRVALKIIRLGMNSQEVIARFAQERQALALMDHPGIAKVFDAGATPFGRPFFVMEMVEGISITDYCDCERLSVRARLEMFMQVCYAVQHAHQKGIIHRDLKPNNVLITTHDGLPAPKVIDFGIAKATEQGHLAGSTLVTRNEAMVGTPLYMSPEQAGSGGADIDTRSDIYALGVLLYVLITGQTPLNPHELNSASFEEMIRLIREGDVPSPTSALRSLDVPELSEAATLRRTPAPRLIQSVRGDLEWICMKALEKDRRRRYASAASFAADIQHFLLNEPITARRPSRWYRLQKLAMRNRNAFTAAAVILLTVLVAFVVSVRETIHARASERQAVASRQEAEKQRRQAEGDRVWAERERTAARLSEYVADIGFAQQSLVDGNLGRATQLLERQTPTGGEADLREFGWRYLWQQCQGDPHESFPEMDGPAAALAFSPAGDLLAIGGLDKVAIYDARTRQLVATLTPGAGSLAFLPDGKTLVTVGGLHLHLWRVSDWQERGDWSEGRGPLALSRDGTRLAVATRDGVRVRDTSDWKEVGFVPGADAPMAFSPDGKALAGVADGKVKLWRLDWLAGREDHGSGATEAPRAKSAQPPRKSKEGVGERGPDANVVLENSDGLFAGEDDTFFRPIQVLAFTPDGTRLLAPQNFLSERGIFLVRTWDTATGREVAPAYNDRTRPEHTGIISALAISPDGATLATTSLDHTVCLWNLSHHLPATRLQGHRAEVGGCAFSPDGRTLVTGDRLGHVDAWPMEQAQAKKNEDDLPGIVRPLGYSKDGQTLAALTADGAVVFYDDAKRPGQRIALEATRLGTDAPVAVSADLKTLVQGLDGGRVKIWRTDTGESRVLFVSDQTVSLAVLSADGKTLITGSHRAHLRMDRLDTGRVTSLPFSARRVVLAPDGKTLAVVASRDVMFGGSVPPGGGGLPPEGAGPPPGAEGPVGPAVTAGGATLRALRGGGMAPMLLARDIVPGLPPSEPPVANGVPLWDLTTNELRTRLNVPMSDVLDGAFAPDGRLFATAVSDNTVQLWEPDGGVLIGTCAGHKQVVQAVAFSYDGRTLASASEDGTLRLWNVSTQQEMLTVLSLGERVSGLSFSPDNQTLVATCRSRLEPGFLRFFRAPLAVEGTGIAARAN